MCVGSNVLLFSRFLDRVKILMKTFCAQQYDSVAEEVMSGAIRNRITGSKPWPEAIRSVFRASQGKRVNFP